jgi:hypothetical protein
MGNLGPTLYKHSNLKTYVVCVEPVCHQPSTLRTSTSQLFNHTFVPPSPSELALEYHRRAFSTTTYHATSLGRFSSMYVALTTISCILTQA